MLCILLIPIGRGSGTRLEPLSGNPPFHGFELLEDIEQDYNDVLYEVELFGSQVCLLN